MGYGQCFAFIDIPLNAKSMETNFTLIGHVTRLLFYSDSSVNLSLLLRFSDLWLFAYSNSAAVPISTGELIVNCT